MHMLGNRKWCNYWRISRISPRQITLCMFGKTDTLNEAECNWGVVKAWAINSGQQWVTQHTVLSMSINFCQNRMTWWLRMNNFTMVWMPSNKGVNNQLWPTMSGVSHFLLLNAIWALLSANTGWCGLLTGPTGLVWSLRHFDCFLFVLFEYLQL